ncbi:MAG: histidinol-phosphate transaminase [Paludibacteraceae bacterium]|nr:histidinol-phosphate transaminase [Paludibacteraceae bacterium]
MSQVMQLVRPNIAGLHPYSTAREEYTGELGTLLDANENPFGQGGLNRYPTAALREQLRVRVAQMKQLPPDSLFLGNGSDEAIDLCFRIFCRPGVDNAVMISPTYGMYQVAADVNDVARREVLLDAQFGLPTDQLLAAADDCTRLMFICSPNNPTANAFRPDVLADIAGRFHGVLVVDEAYVDFSDKGSVISYLADHHNIIVLQTLSKAYGLAGLRVGLAVAHPDIIRLFNNVKYPYNIGTDTLQTALRMLDDSDVLSQVQLIRSERDRLSAQLTGLPGVVRVYPSDANFLLVRFEHPGSVYRRLLEAGIIVRDRSHVAGCDGCLRITVGTPEENQQLISILQQ